jgi:Cellulose biosynthesis protein BcsS
MALKATITRSTGWPAEAQRTHVVRLRCQQCRHCVWSEGAPRLKKSLFYGEAEYTTAFQTYYTSAKYGYDVFNKGFFIGPEVTAFGDARYDQWRVGAHIAQMQFGQVEVDVSARFAHDSSVGDGAYGYPSFDSSRSGKPSDRC